MSNQRISDITEDLFLKTPENVTGVWYGFKKSNGKFTNELSIVFNVKEKLPVDKIPENELLPKEIIFSGKTIKTDVVSEEFKALQDCPADFYEWNTIPPENRSKIRPLQGGLAITNYTKLYGYYGTFGFLAEDTETNSLVGVTNNHVIIDDAFINTERTGTTISNTINNVVIQPYNSPSDNVGIVKRYYPIYSNGINYIDCALFTVDSKDIDNNVSYNQLNLSGWTQPLEFATTSEIDNLLSTYPNLFSSGARTGDKGEGDMKLLPNSIGATVSVGGYNKQGSSISVNFGDCIIFVASATTTPNGYICSYPINSGDSGSALIADFNGVRKIIGLCFAGSTFYGIANRIDRVSSLINIRSWSGQTINYSDINNVQKITLPHSRSDLNKIFSGNTYWQSGLESF